MAYKPYNDRFHQRTPGKRQPRTARLSMRLPPNVLARLNEIARKEGVSATHVVETLIQLQYKVALFVKDC